MNHSLKTRVLAMVLVVVMLIGVLPISAFATETEVLPEESQVVTTNYTVEHYLQTADGYELDTEATETLTGEVGAVTNAVAKPYEGYTAKEFEQVTIAEDGSTVVAIYYDYEVAATSTGVNYTVEHHLEDADGKFVKDADRTQTLTGEAGKNTAATALVIENYTAKGITQKAITADGKTVVVVQYERKKVNYTVNHILHYANGTELLSQTEKLSLGWGKKSDGGAKYEGKRTMDKVEVALDGSTVIDVHYDVAYTANKHGLPSEMDIITNDESMLAPGVAMNEIALHDKNGKRVEMQITTSDTSVDTVHFYANYKDNQNQVYGLQTLSEQVAAMEANYEEPFKIVAGINASYYNTTTGKPTGAFVMEGIDVTTESEGNNYAFFAVLKDGTVMIGDKGEYSKYKGQIKEAIGGYVHILKDGAIVSGLDKTTKYPRQTIGITADGKVITMTADGSQTQTVGLTYYEQALVMQTLGCVEALHLDGGNSATFGAIREGTDKFVTVNSPSGMAERAVSNTLMIVSTAVADGTFDHAVISGEYEYQLPYTTTTYSAIGVDAANGAAEIPETAIWTLSDDSFGTIENGVFVSNGKTGDVNIQLSDNAKVIGSKTIHVVNPTAISFGADEATIPYGKTASLAVIAMYNNNEAFCEAGNFDWTLNPAAAGTLNGFEFAASNDESITSAVVTATYKFAELNPASVTVKFGKGSEVLFDFEDGDISDWHGIETIFDWIDEKNAANPDAKYPVSEPQNEYSNGIDKQTSSVFLASEENGGKVKNGNYSLGFSMNHRNVTDIGGWLYNYLYYTGETKVLRDVANGVNGIRIGMWVYTDTTNVAFRIVRNTEKADGTMGITYKYMKSGYDGKNVSYATNYGIPESGWIYVYYDLTDLADTIRQTTSLYDPDNNNGVAYGSSGANYYPAFLQFFTGSATDVPQEMIFYIDDITLDYSEVTDDRDAPVITNMMVSTDGANDVTLNGQTVFSNQLTFSASIADKSGNANMTGLDYTTAKIYVDGIDMSGNAGFKAVNGVLSLNNVNLTNGEHSVAFAVCDKQGNETRVTKTLTVAGSAANAVVSAVGRNEGNHTPKAGSVYYIDIKASDAAQIGTVTTTFKLDKSNRFEYQNILCAEGVTATASYDELDREVTVTLTHDGSLAGEAVLASIPVRVWAWDEAATGITADKQFASGAIPTIDIEWKTTYGKVTYADGAFSDYIAGFYGAEDIATELDDKTAWHKHTAAAVTDQPATCTTAGYTGRTYCDGCKSVVNWGTTVPSTGHIYEIGEDGILDCTCGEKFTGIHTDGKEYVDGVAKADGWSGDSYYQGGKKLTGIHKVPASDGTGEFYYDFGEDGTCADQIKYTGLLQEAEGKYYYSKLGVLTGGWNMIGEDWYYFDAATKAAVSGKVKVNGVYFDFEENGKLVSGVWVNILAGYRYYYGPSYYTSKWAQIDGEWYYFVNGLRVTGFNKVVTFQTMAGWTWYEFDEDGVLQGIADGFCDVDGKMHYIVNGKEKTGLQLIDGDYYHLDYYGAVETGRIAVGSNEYLPGGYYYFGEDGKMMGTSETGEIIEIDGVRYLYAKGRPYGAGLIQLDDGLYFAQNAGVLATGSVYVWNTNGIMPEDTYLFDETGKMVGSNADGVIVEVDGVNYYYKNGKPSAAGLMLRDGSYYFAGSKGKLATGATYVYNGNGLMKEDTYYFGADGAMLGVKVVDGQPVVGEMVDMDGSLYYFKNGKPTAVGLIEIDGYYYFVGTDGKVAIGVQYVWNGNGLVAEDNYYFGADGKMAGIRIVDGQPVLGEIIELDGSLYYYEKGKAKVAGLIKLDGNFYFAGLEGKLAVGECYVWQGNGMLKENTYYFAEDGKLIGLKEVEGETVSGEIIVSNGAMYYYKNGKPEPAGLILHDGYYYFAGVGGKISTGLTYVWRPNGLISEDNYYFGEDGKMLGINVVDGTTVHGQIVDLDGTLYYYEDGKPQPAGLLIYEGYYYFADVGGKISTGLDYVWRPNGLLAEDNYYFGEDGKMLGVKMVDGNAVHGQIVDIDDVKYYYENGKPQPAGLVVYEGYYYFADVGGKVATGEKYVWRPNGLMAQDTYIFGADGKMLGIKVVDGAIVSGEIVQTADGSYYYLNGKCNAAGLIVVDGHYYFAGINGKVAVGESYVWKTNGLLPENTYTFDEEGKMLGVKVVDGNVVSGEIVEYNGALYYFKNGRGTAAGLLYLDGGYYFAAANGKLVVSQDFYVWEGNGLLLEQTYTFDTNGRIVA